MKSIIMLIAFASGAAAAEPTVTLPKEVQARPGRLVQIKADTAGKTVRWFCPSAYADLLPYPGADKTAIFCSPLPGQYAVYAYTAAGDVPSEPACCIVTVAGPTPPPVPPPPSDPFTQALQAAYEADAGPDKAKQLNLYRQVLLQAASTTVNDGALKTVSQLRDVVHQAARSLIADGLTAPRQVIEAELNRTLPTSTSASLDANRDLCRKELSRIADALGRVKP